MYRYMIQSWDTSFDQEDSQDFSREQRTVLTLARVLDCTRETAQGYIDQAKRTADRDGVSLDLLQKNRRTVAVCVCLIS